MRSDKMVTVSLCMIVKNEEEVLERCLTSAQDIVNAINIVDTGSTDETIKIAKKITDRVFQFEWTGKFKDARNESFKHATKEYIFYVDADDVLLERDREKFKILTKTLDPSVDSVSMYYNAGMDEDRKSTRLNSSHVAISYAVFCLKKIKKPQTVNRFIVYIVQAHN